MLSFHAKQALRILVVMAGGKFNEQYSAAYISQILGLSVEDVFQVIDRLTSIGWIEGSNWEDERFYRLAILATEMKVGTLLRQIDGPLAPIRCASLTAYQRCNDCGDENSCEVRHVMIEVRKAMSSVLDHVSIADMNARQGMRGLN